MAYRQAVAHQQMTGRIVRSLRRPAPSTTPTPDRRQPTMSTLTQAQRNAITYALGHLLHIADPDDTRVILTGIHTTITPEQYREIRENLARWASSWVTPSLAALLADADGKPMRPGEMGIADYAQYMNQANPAEVAAYVDQWTRWEAPRELAERTKHDPDD